MKTFQKRDDGPIQVVLVVLIVHLIIPLWRRSFLSACYLLGLFELQEKKNRVLEKCYSPVMDEITSDCEVEGVIPEELHGEFARIGPNPRFPPRGDYHWFDGDGLVRGSTVMWYP